MLNLPSSNHAQAGFTLVETIIALLVLTISVGSLFLVYALATPHSAKAIEEQRARLIADAYYQYLKELKYQSSAGGCAIDGPESEEQRNAYDDVDDLNGVVDAPPIIFGQPFLGLDNVYENYSVSFAVMCVQSPIYTTGKQHMSKRVAFSVIAPSGQDYRFEMVKGPW